MESNQHRGSAGKTLLAFALLAAVVAAFSLYLRATRDKNEFVSYPTALGDTDLYTTELGPGFDMFFPNLVFEGMPESLAPGLYRRNHGPVTIRDSRVTRLAREKGDRHWVYSTPSHDGKTSRYFLKVADDSFIEFGEQKYFRDPSDTRPAARLAPTGQNGDPTPAPDAAPEAERPATP